MRGSVTGHYLAVLPDTVTNEEKKIEEGALEGFVIESSPSDSNERARMDASATTGTVLSVGNMCWRAYDGNDPDWKPWAKVGDRIVFVRHSAKIIKDEEDTDELGKPKEIWIIADENCTWNFDEDEKRVK